MTFFFFFFFFFFFYKPRPGCKLLIVSRKIFHSDTLPIFYRNSLSRNSPSAQETNSISHGGRAICPRNSPVPASAPAVPGLR